MVGDTRRRHGFSFSVSFSSPATSFSLLSFHLCARFSSRRFGISVSKSNKSLGAFLEPQREKSTLREQTKMVVAEPAEWVNEAHSTGGTCTFPVGWRSEITGLSIAFILSVLSFLLPCTYVFHAESYIRQVMQLFVQYFTKRLNMRLKNLYNLLREILKIFVVNINETLLAIY